MENTEGSRGTHSESWLELRASVPRTEMFAFLRNKPASWAFLSGATYILTNEESCDLHKAATSESLCVSPLPIRTRCCLWQHTPPTTPQGRARPNHFRWLLLKLPGKKKKNPHSPPFKLLKNPSVAKLFLPTLNPLCCTLSAHLLLFGSQESNRRAYHETLKKNPLMLQ